MSQISGKDYITTLWENIWPFCILLKCRHLKCLGKTLLLPFSSIFYPIKFLWNYILLILLVRILLFCFMNLFYHSFVPITCSSDVQEGLCNFCLKSIFWHVTLYNLYPKKSRLLLISQIIPIIIFWRQLKMSNIYKDCFC